MHDTTALARPASPYNPADNPRFSKLHRRFPTVAYLRRHARRQVPNFAFEYMAGGAGADGGIARNSHALDAVELVPRYGITTALPPVDVELFGKRYSAPIGVAPSINPNSTHTMITDARAILIRSNSTPSTPSTPRTSAAPITLTAAPPRRILVVVLVGVVGGPGEQAGQPGERLRCAVALTVSPEC